MIGLQLHCSPSGSTTAGLSERHGRQFVMVVFLYHPVQLIWEPSAALISELARAAYNYYNLPQP